MKKSLLRIATRKSPLALWQANYVKNLLQNHYPELRVEFIPLLTTGDKKTDVELTKIGGKSLFVKELQAALLNDEADIAVHCIKDMSVIETPGLQLTAVCVREDPRDAFISNTFKSWSELPNNAIVGTASPRRQCQLLAMRSDIIIKPLRGNVGTRLNKLDNHEFDAIVLASAGLKRLNLASRITQYFSLQEFLPAIGQGALGIECRAEDKVTQSLVKIIDDAPTNQCVQAERAINFRLGGDCYTPIGAYGYIQEQTLWLEAMVGNLDGQQIVRDKISGPVDQAYRLGIKLAEKLLAKGADKFFPESS